MAVVFRKEYLVDSRSVDMHNQCKPSAMLGYLQEIATGAAVNLHASGYEVEEKYHAMWMVARIACWMDRPVPWNEVLTIETWHRGGKGASIYRDFDIYGQDGKQIGEATSVWVLADVDDFHLLRMSDISEFVNTDGGDRCKSIRLPKLRMPAEMREAETRLLRYSETDINRHINNTRYADYTADALHLENLGFDRYVSHFAIDFRKQCMPGETLHLLTSSENGVNFVRGTDGEGDIRYDSIMETDMVKKSTI